MDFSLDGYYFHYALINLYFLHDYKFLYYKVLHPHPSFLFPSPSITVIEKELMSESSCPSLCSEPLLYVQSPFSFHMFYVKTTLVFSPRLFKKKNLHQGFSGFFFFFSVFFLQRKTFIKCVCVCACTHIPTYKKVKMGSLAVVFGNL